MNITYSSQLSAPIMAVLQSRERYVRAALSALPAQGSFRWTTWALPDGRDCYVLRHVCDDDRCVVWFSFNELVRKFTESHIATCIREQKRLTPGQP